MSRDARGWRAKFGVLGPSTNTIVQPDFDDLRPEGVTNHYSRIVIENAQAISDETFMAGTLEISDNTTAAVRGVLTCAPDYLIMGMSAVTFYGGAEGGRRWRENIEAVAGVSLSIGSEALAAALEALGGIRRVALISPYFPVANTEVRR
ncbi:MAG: arylmalonate decarboxylase, partial [Planctomycetota bacterium]